jgi:hypothetical protein
MIDKQPADVAALFKELEAAMALHKEAERAESAARSVMCDATNRLNRAQKAVDDHVRSLKANAPWNTDWRSQRDKGVAV